MCKRRIHEEGNGEKKTKRNKRYRNKNEDEGIEGGKLSRESTKGAAYVWANGGRGGCLLFFVDHGYKKRQQQPPGPPPTGSSCGRYVFVSEEV